MVPTVDPPERQIRILSFTTKNLIILRYSVSKTSRARPAHVSRIPLMSTLEQSGEKNKSTSILNLVALTLTLLWVNCWCGLIDGIKFVVPRPTCLSYSFSSRDVRCVAALNSFWKKENRKPPWAAGETLWRHRCLIKVPRVPAQPAAPGLWGMFSPVHRKSSAWPDTAACSSWTRLQCPLQTLSAENGSSYKTAGKSTMCRIKETSVMDCTIGFKMNYKTSWFFFI